MTPSRHDLGGAGIPYGLQPEHEGPIAPGTLIVVAMETLWPPNHGGRVDRWNRWKLMKALGWRLLFVSWAHDESHRNPAARAAMAELFDECHYFPNIRTIGSITRRMALLPWRSPHMASRLVPAHQRRKLVRALRCHRPDAVVMDGLYGADLGIYLAEELRLPLFYRSHNIEHLYMQRQSKAARGWKRKFATGLASLHLEGAEQHMFDRADHVFDISADDLRFWQGRGIDHIEWLPPLVDAKTITSVDVLEEWSNRPYDAVYLGNLHTPNNVEGLAWLVERVLPALRPLRPDIRILIAGSNPSAALRALVADQPGIDLLPDPESVAETRARGRVMINPVLQGSGINVKTIEMLFTDAPVVTTPVGVQGLASDMLSVFLVADDPEEFARLIDEALDKGPVVDKQRARVRAFFSENAVSAFSRRLAGLIRTIASDKS